MSVTTKRLLQTQVFEKKAIFPVKKNLTNFSLIIEYDRPQGTIFKGPKGVVAITVLAKRSNL